MSYTVHNFQNGDILKASQLNEMDEQIKVNSEGGSSSGVVVMKTTDTYTDDSIINLLKQLMSGTTVFVQQLTTDFPSATDDNYTGFGKVVSFSCGGATSLTEVNEIVLGYVGFNNYGLADLTLSFTETKDLTEIL